MNGRERMAAAMRLQKPDCVPVMCQLSLGHYFLNVPLPREEIWFGAEGFSEALVTLARRYRFDGVLVNLLPAPPDWRKEIDRIAPEADGALVLHWKNGGGCRIPADDNLHHFPPYQPPDLADVKPEDIYYDDPHGMGGMKHPFHFGLSPARGKSGFPDYLFRTVEQLKTTVGGELSVHAEVFSPFTQLMELFGYGNALMHLVTDAGKCHDILSRYAEGTSELAGRFARRGADAILISSAFAGGGFISRDFYCAFVQPYERRVAQAVAKAAPGTPVYVHTCGAIGDRLEMMVETGFNGIDTLDPPPLGNVRLDDAKRRIGGRLFIKGNLDPVGVLLNGNAQNVMGEARKCLEQAAFGGGYILSSACSVPPFAPAENISLLYEAAEKFGRYV